jgi:hypothetical protein
VDNSNRAAELSLPDKALIHEHLMAEIFQARPNNRWLSCCSLTVRTGLPLGKMHIA